MDSREGVSSVLEGLQALGDGTYRAFHCRLIPEVPAERVIGVRTPLLRGYAKKLAKEQPEQVREFLAVLPHFYYEENQLHGELMKLIFRDLDSFLPELERFLPYVDNWATCDMLSPKVFLKDLGRVYPYVQKWLGDKEHPFTVRFGVVTMLQFYLKDGVFCQEMLSEVAEISSEEYYVKMAVAWYMSMALVKQYEAALPYIENNRLDVWTHNKSIQKAIESRQISDERKSYLRSQKRKQKENVTEHEKGSD